MYQNVSKPHEFCYRFWDTKKRQFFSTRQTVTRSYQIRVGDVLGLHGGAELPGDDEAGEVVEHGGESNCLTGNVIVNVEPLPGVLLAVMAPL